MKTQSEFCLIIPIILFICISFINCKCITTFIHQCETLKDVKQLSEKTWESLAVSPFDQDGHYNNISLSVEDSILTREVLQSVKNLQELYIVETLQKIDANAFVDHRKLEFVQINRNSIPVILHKTFGNQNHLRKLDLSSNGIESVQAYSFPKAVLSTIKLSNNRLTAIQTDVFNFPSLTELYLDQNKITYIAEHAFGNNIEKLELSRNNISIIGTEVLANMYNLKYLNLSSNFIESVTSNFETVKAMNKIEIFDISHNRLLIIEDRALSQLTSVQELYLNDNRLLSFNYMGFAQQKLPIRTLYLHRNHLMGIGGEWGDGRLGDLKTITIGGNPWVCKMMHTLEEFMKPLHRPRCELEHFGSGQYPVCIVDYDAEYHANPNNTEIRDTYKCQY